MLPVLASALRDPVFVEPSVSRVALLVPESDGPARRILESLAARPRPRS